MVTLLLRSKYRPLRKNIREYIVKHMCVPTYLLPLLLLGPTTSVNPCVLSENPEGGRAGQFWGCGRMTDRTQGYAKTLLSMTLGSMKVLISTVSLLGLFMTHSAPEPTAVGDSLWEKVNCTLGLIFSCAVTHEILPARSSGNMLTDCRKFASARRYCSRAASIREGDVS